MDLMKIGGAVEKVNFFEEEELPKMNKRASMVTPAR
jgi:hypothetical protein